MRRRTFAVVAKQVDGERATIITCHTSKPVRARRSLAEIFRGPIRTTWKLETGGALRRWEIVETENVSLKYKNLPKPPTQNSNR
jgi:hypothetical protein